MFISSSSGNYFRQESEEGRSDAQEKQVEGAIQVTKPQNHLLGSVLKGRNTCQSGK